jgi:RNA polymerase sigma-70 factor (ECF subfamily)
MPDGPDAKFTMLYDKQYDEVLAYCTRRIGRSEADDATADVFAVAWRRIDEIEWTTVRPWLYGIARGVLANRWRSGRRQKRLLGRVSGLARAPDELPDVQVVRRAQDDEVVAAVRKLKPADQEVLLLAAWEELTASEIAIAVGISVSAAEQRLHRAKQRLAKALLYTTTAPNLSPRAAKEGGRR